MKNFLSFKASYSQLKTLTYDEKKILPDLIEAARKIDRIYLLQENEKYPGANFYPHDVSIEQIKSAAKRNPKILSPFTIVEKDKSGSLIAIDYHLKYAKLLQPVANLISSAAKKAANQSFRSYLKILAASLVSGDFQQVDIAWLSVKRSNIDVTFGPYERNLDKSFFVKRAYQAHVAIIDHEKTSKARRIRDILYTNMDSKLDRISPPTIVDIQVESNLISAGLLGSLVFSQQHLPSDADLTEKYGSRIIGFLNSIDYKFEKLIYPVFEAVFEKDFKLSYSKDLLQKGNYYNVLLHSIAQQLHRYQNSRENLKELFPVFDEANSIVTGILSAKHLVLKGVINQKELEAIIICYICWIFSEWVIAQSTKSRESYLKGDTLSLNFLIREGAILEKNGVSWPNFAKIFFEIENLSKIFVRLLAEGTHEEANEFLSKFLSFELFEAFSPKLKTIKAP